MKNLFACIADSLKKCIPTNVLNILAQTDLNNISRDELLNIKGVANKRADLIMNVIKLAKAKYLANFRKSTKVEAKEKCLGYNVYRFSKENVWNIEDTSVLKFRYNGNSEELLKAREQFQVFQKAVFGHKIVIDWDNKTVVRMNRSDLSDIFCINYEDRRPTTKLFVVEYGIQEMFDLDWHLFGSIESQANKAKDEFLERVCQKLTREGAEIIDGNKVIANIALVTASSSHLKQEVAIFAKVADINANAYALYFGKPKDEFYKLNISGVDLLKMRSIFQRPNTMELDNITLRDILVVNSIERNYLVKNGVMIGKIETSKALINYGTFNTDRKLADGQMMAIRPISNQGQLKLIGMKAMVIDGSSSLKAVAEKFGMTYEEILDCEIKGIDGRFHRLGDYALVCTEDCWKVDKAFDNYDEYLAWTDRMEILYPGITRVCLLRQAEEVEDIEKRRTITRTLLQQLMTLSAKDQRKLTLSTRQALKKLNTVVGAYRTLSGGKNEDPTKTQKVFRALPGLVLDDAILDYINQKFDGRLLEALAGKLRIDGEYPYICEDPVAIWEIIVFNKDPQSDDLGILRGNEISLSDIPNGRECVVVRYPANDMTALVMKNCACVEEFESLNNVMAISIYSDMLIRQDGDTDGDEAAVILTRLIIDLFKDMHAKFNPPVVLFAHGHKGAKPSFKNETDMLNSVGTALFKSKKFDGVGRYANLASRCAYLASVAFANHKEAAAQMYLGYMHAASTGAIMAIDQVKGNDVDPALVAWLDDIDAKTKKVMALLAQNLGVDAKEAYKVKFNWTKQFELQAKKKEVKDWQICPFNESSFIDQTSMLIKNDVGTFKDFNKMGLTFDAKATARAIRNNDFDQMPVPNGYVSHELLDALEDNWFVTRNVGEEKLDVLRDELRLGNQIRTKDLLELLWRNEITASYHMEGKTLNEKRDEYRELCKEILFAYVDGTRWVENRGHNGHEAGYEYTSEEKRAMLVNWAVTGALELQFDKDGKRYHNKINMKGSFAMFVLGMFADEVLENIKVNGVDNTKYLMLESAAAEDAFTEELEEELVAFEVEQPESEYVPDYDEIFGIEEIA